MEYLAFQNILLYVLEDLITCFENIKKNIEDSKNRVEELVLNYLKENKEISNEFKRILDNEHLPFIKKHRPDIIASWRYYAEFEKMCEELDGY